MPLLMEVKPAAAELSIGVSKLYELIREGRLNSVQIGARRLIERAELERFIASLREAGKKT